MKKTVSLLLALLLTTGMAAISACGPVDPDTSTPGTSQSAEGEKLEIREAALAAATVGKSYTVDLSGIKVVGENGAESDLAVSVRNGEVKKPDGTAVKMQNNAFTPDVAGSWSVVVYVEGHPEIAEKTLTIEAEYDTSAVGLSSYDSIGFESIWDGYITFEKVVRTDASTDKFYGSENYSAKMTMVEGKETKSIRLWMDMDEQDWSKYDYVKFYVYNATNVSLRISLCEDDNNNSLMRPSVGTGAWTPVVIPLTEGAKIASNRNGWDGRVWQELNKVETLGLFLDIAEDNNNWSTGNMFRSGSIYFSAIRGGNYETTDEKVLIPVEEGINPSNVARIRMINHYNIVESTEQKAADEAMSLKLYALKDFPSGDDLVITYNHRYYLQPDYTGDVYMWVYNACASAVDIVGKTTVTLQPNEGKYVTFTASATASASEIVIKVGSSVIKKGDALYFGNVYKGFAPEDDEGLSINASALADGEFGEKYTLDLSSVKVTNAGGGAVDRTVSVKNGEVRNPSGEAVKLEDNAFTPSVAGTWTVTLFVDGHPTIPEKTVTIEVKDTKAPVIEPDEELADAKIGDEITIPEFTVTDANALQGELEISVTDPDSAVVTVTEGKFVAEKEGTYTITAKQKDAAGNEGTYTMEIRVSSYDAPTVGLSSYDSIGFENVWNGYITFEKVVRTSTSTDKFYGSENYSAKMTMVEGKETKSIRLWMDMDEQDWSGYDYVKFYVYNDTNVSVRLSLCEDNNDNSLMRPNVGTGAWTPVVIPLTQGAQIVSNRNGWDGRVRQELDQVQTLGLLLEIAEDNNTWSTGNMFRSGSIYFSAIQGGNYGTEDENVLIPVEEGINPSNVARIRMINHYNIVESTEHLAADEGMSMKLYALKDFPSGDDLIITFNGRYYLQADYAGDVHMWVYNASASAVNVYGTATVTLQPNEGKYVTFAASAKEIVIKIGSSVLKEGDALYFGNVYKGAAAEGLTSYDSIGYEAPTVTAGEETVPAFDSFSFEKVTADTDTGDVFYGNERYSAKLSMSGGESLSYLRIWMDMDEQDWSGYDYVKFYVYNDTNVSVRIALCVDDDNNSLMRPSVGNGGVWTPVVIPLVDGATIPSNRSGWGQRVEQPLNRVQTLGLYLTIAENNNNWNTGNAFKEGSIYFSAIQGGNYETEDEDVLIPVEEGINPSNVARIRMINHYNIVESTEQKAADEAMSLKLYALKDFPSGDDLVITYNHRYYLQPDYTGDVYMWVYNACASAVDIVGKTTVTLQPNEGKYVTFTASSSEIVIKVGSSVMKTGDAIYFGNVYKGAAE